MSLQMELCNFLDPNTGLEPRPRCPLVFSYPVLFPLSHPGQHTCNCSELLLLPVVLIMVIFLPSAIALRLLSNICNTQSKGTGKFSVFLYSVWNIVCKMTYNVQNVLCSIHLVNMLLHIHTRQSTEQRTF